MTLIFKYKEVKRPHEAGEKVKTPATLVTFVGPKATFDIICIIDSGADISILSKETAEVLGISLSGKMEYSYGVGGKVQTVPSHVEIRIGHGQEVYKDTIPVRVVLDPYDMPPLLGRKGFFELYEVTIKEKKQRVELTRLQKQATKPSHK